MIDHAKTLINSTGGFNKLGKLHSRVEGRIIQERDLPNPKMRNLIGKFGMFGKFFINHYVEEVRKGLIKPLSPGIDLEAERIAEASAVAFPAIYGPALFRAEYPPNSQANFSISYGEAKEQEGFIRKLKEEAQQCFDILFRVIADIDAADINDMIGATPNSLKLRAANDFYADFLNLLELNQQETEMEEPAPQSIAIDPYASLPEAYDRQYSKDNGDKAEFNGNGTLKKRKRS